MQLIERRPDLADCDFSDAVPPLLRRIYAGRGVRTDAELGRQLSELPDPGSLKGVQAAVALLEQALAEGQRVLVVGDFDADGATSTALTMLALRAMGLAEIDFLVPNRFEYGYGLTPEIVELARSRDPDLLVTVDNGISSIEGVAAARQAGIRVLVTDHHLPGEQLPGADAIVNPNQPGCDFPGKQLAGVGVMFYLLTALRARLRDSGWFERRNMREPGMATWLDLVALGTVADVVPLDRFNRVLVHQGLRRVRAGRCRPGIAALLEVAGRQRERLVAADFGFAVGPRLNAAGRLDDMSLGIACLLAEDPARAREEAAQLDTLNRERREIETGMQREAQEAVERLHLEARDLPSAICLQDPLWHQGVVGLLAARIRERYHRPVIAFAEGDDGQLKGSARSIPGLHIRDTLDAVAARHPGLIRKFGGHAMAAGLALDADRYPAFAAAFEEEVERRLDADTLREEVLIDGVLAPRELTIECARQLRDAGPWGQQFPEPLFRGEFTVLRQRVLAGRHLKFTLALLEDVEQWVDAIAFNVPEAWLERRGERLDILYKMDVNLWQGRESLQLVVERILALD